MDTKTKTTKTSVKLKDVLEFINTGRLDGEGLDKIRLECIEREKKLARQVSSKFRPGEVVSFKDSDGKVVTGPVDRVNQTTVRVGEYRKSVFDVQRESASATN